MGWECIQMSRWHLMTLAMKGTVASTLRQKRHVIFTGATQLAMQNLSMAEPRSFASAASAATSERLWWQFYDRRQQHDKLINVLGKALGFLSNQTELFQILGDIMKIEGISPALQFHFKVPETVHTPRGTQK